MNKREYEALRLLFLEVAERKTEHPTLVTVYDTLRLIFDGKPKKAVELISSTSYSLYRDKPRGEKSG